MSESASPFALEPINIVVRDLPRSLDRLLGVSIEEPRGPEWDEWPRHPRNGTTSNGVRVEFDSVAFAKQWNPGSRGEARLRGDPDLPRLVTPAVSAAELTAWTEQSRAFRGTLDSGWQSQF